MLRGSSAIARLIAVIALLVGAGAALLLAGAPVPRPAAAQTPPTDYDTDDNGLIEVSNLDQLNAMRWDLSGLGVPAGLNASSYAEAFPDRDTTPFAWMGCPEGCIGYELMADLTFPASGRHATWTPIGTFTATFDGNGHTLSGMTIDIGGTAGLFERLASNGVVRDLGMINPNVRATAAGLSSGAIVGVIQSGGRVYSSYVQGGSVTLTANNANGGGLAGANSGMVRASYATAAVRVESGGTVNDIGGLVGRNINTGAIVASYAAGAMAAAAGNDVGGLVGNSHGASSTITDSYCDTEAAGLMNCVGSVSNSADVTVEGKTSAELKEPRGYTGIYRDWDIDVDGDGEPDDPWYFGGPEDYPAPWYLGSTDSPPPGGPREAQPPQDTPYDPAADHPEVYVNDRWEMAATCEVQDNGDGTAESALIRFDLGRYAGAVILHLAVWNGEFFMSYESQDIDVPPLVREGQSAWVRVVTDPGETRFLLDSVSPTRNLVLGYADCHTDDPGAVVAESAAESADTSTAAMPAPPKVYVNDQYEMTASCQVQNNADGNPESSLIRFDLGSYEGDVLLSMSLWNGEWYASYESLDIESPLLEREGQLASVRVVTDPGETRFLLDGTPNGLRMNLVLGYADCHTDGG